MALPSDETKRGPPTIDPGGYLSRQIKIGLPRDVFDWISRLASAIPGRSKSEVARVILQAEMDRRETIAREVARAEENEE